jgi:hypothetical protein
MHTTPVPYSSVLGSPLLPSVPAAAQPSLFKAMMVIMFLSPVGSSYSEPESTFSTVRGWMVLLLGLALIVSVKKCSHEGYFSE